MYDVEKRGNVPIYEYLYKCIRDDIVSGRIGSGEKLLSKRRLARQEGVALITVENAYEQLLVEGYIESRQRSGYYVSFDASRFTIGDYCDDSNKSSNTNIYSNNRIYNKSNIINQNNNSKAGYYTSNMANYKSSVIVNANGKANYNVVNKAANKADYNVANHAADKAAVPLVADFVSQRLHDDAFPFDIWSKLMRKVLSDRNPECLAPPDPCGLPVLRYAIAGYLMRSRGIEADPDNIIVGPGTEYLENILLVLSGGGALTAVEDPGYKKMGLLCERAGHKCLHIPVDKDGLDVSALEGTSVRLVNISPSHHFPTGAIMSAGRRAQLLNWAEMEDAYIAEDDYDSEFRFSGRPIPPISAAYPERVIYMNTFTRTLAPSIRIAFMVLPDKLMERYRQKLSFYSGTVSSFDQLVLAEFINGGYYERHLSRMRNFYGKRRESIMKLFESSNTAHNSKSNADKEDNVSRSKKDSASTDKKDSASINKKDSISTNTKISVSSNKKDSISINKKDSVSTDTKISACSNNKDTRESNNTGIFTPIKDAAGLRIVLKAPLITDDEKFISALADKGIKLTCMNDYCYSHNEKYDHLFLVSFGSASEDVFAKALPVMEETAKMLF